MGKLVNDEMLALVEKLSASIKDGFDLDMQTVATTRPISAMVTSSIVNSLEGIEPAVKIDGMLRSIAAVRADIDGVKASRAVAAQLTPNPNFGSW